MKKIILFAVFNAMMAIASFSQSIGDLPATTVVIHYKLSVGYNTTSILIFPSAVQQVDRGERDLMAQKQPGVENVLKVKAARRDFTPTNLHVFTGDGRVYAFDVIYVSDPAQTTFDLTRLTSTDTSNHTGQIELSTKPLDKQKITREIVKIKASKPFFSSRIHKYRMEVELQAIYRSDDILYLEFKLTNRATLPYDIDFTRLYIQDKKRMKRSSIQQCEITPIYQDTFSNIPGNSSRQWVIGIPQLTISDHRELIFELNEKNGGRHLFLSLRNQQLFKAKAL